MITAPLTPEARKAVINELSALSQSVWFTLLGALAFLGIVLLSTTDADFLMNASRTELPLVQVSVPTERFFFLAPIVTTALYLYLHFYCLKLWAQYAVMQPKAIDSSIQPTLINDLALHLCREAKPRGGQDWAWISGLVTMLLVWAFHPALLLAIIYKSGAASGGWSLASVRGMTLACLLVSLAVGLLSLCAALRIRYRSLSGRRAFATIFLPAFLAGTLGAFALSASFPAIDIDRANLAAVGPEWPYAAERREAFRIEWCGREKTALAVCGLLAPNNVAERARIAELQRDWCREQKIRGCQQSLDRLDAGFAAHWSVKRRSELGRLPELDLSGRSLAQASAQGVRLVNARLERADLAGARLAEAQLEGAVLIDARLEDAEAYYASFDRANLTGASLARANLASSSLEGAVLPGAALAGANLTEAQLADADLSGAVLVAANLTRASLRRADLGGALLAGAILDGADLSGVRNLTQDQLANAVGDADTLLPAGLKPLQTCWRELPARAEALVVTGVLPARTVAALEARLCVRDSDLDRLAARPRPRPAEPEPIRLARR